MINRCDCHVPTVEKRIKTRVFDPFLNTLALQISDKSSVASNTPKAPPLEKSTKYFLFIPLN
jgi:hypothetical protein